MCLRDGYANKMWTFIISLIFLVITLAKADIYFKHGEISMRYNVAAKRDTISKKEACKCHCQRKWKNNAWECCDCPWSQTVCFPGDALVTLETGENIAMEKLRQGHRVMAVSDERSVMYSEVRVFLKRYPDDLAVYLDLQVENGDVISLSESHVLFSSTTNDSKDMQPIFAGRIKMGDYLFTDKDCPVGFCAMKITKITPMVRKGVYVPLTTTGTIVVNRMAASCYSSINHYIAHFVTTPIRLVPWLLGDQQREGYSPIVNFLKKLGHWVLPSSMQFNMENEGLAVFTSRSEL